MLHSKLPQEKELKPLPLFSWAEKQQFSASLTPAERTVSLRYCLSPHMAKVVAEHAGLGPREH